MSRKLTTKKAKVLHDGMRKEDQTEDGNNEFLARTGSFTNFMNRNRLSLPLKTSIEQKHRDKLINKLLSFVF